MQKLRWVIGRWWFWVVVVALILVAFYLAGYLKWYAEGAKYRIQNEISNQYIASQEREQAALEAQYKNDPYGGATPEATLKLFIEALEKKDYALASNYFVPEKRAEELSALPEAVKSGGVDMMINAYINGKLTSEKYGGQDKYEIRLFPPQDDVPFVFTLIKNPFTIKWLISDL